jgi:hypothetical protein
VKVIYTRTLVRIYCNGETVATHRRDCKPGGYTVVEEHLASHSKAFRDRSPDYYIKRGEKVTAELAEVITKMFETARVPPETFYKSCDGLFHLAKTTDPDLFKTACRTALQYHIYKYGFINQLIKSKCEGSKTVNSDDANKVIPPTNHRHVRGKEQFR